MPTPLPIEAVLPELGAKLRAYPSVVLRAPTGAGKTTRVPPALASAGFATTGRIVMLEPRRLAARAAARRMADEAGTRLGDRIGYHVRFDRQAGPTTQILVVTPGILLRMLQADPFLENVAVVLFDEFHERGLESDLALGSVRLLQTTVRPDLKLVAMSATLEGTRVAAYLGDAPIVASEGRLHPVTIRYEPKGAEEPWPEAAARAAERALSETPGDVLVFLPGMLEIRRTADALAGVAARLGVAVLPLHGDLPPDEQDRALRPQEGRRIVLATNVAETSVTVEGITAVVDTGLARRPVFDPSVGLDCLAIVPIARSAADQRAGRAGRTQPGLCLRLWSESSHKARAEQTEPEIRHVDPAGAVLHLLALGESDLDAFPWYDPPPRENVAHALELLRLLGAVSESPLRLTELGTLLAKLPVHPRLGALLVAGHRLGYPFSAALAAALLTERDPFPRVPQAVHSSASDLVDRVEVLETIADGGRADGPLGTPHHAGTRLLLRAAEQLERTIGQELGPEPAASCPADEGLQRALLAAFPDRVARRRDGSGRRGLMVGGRGVRLADGSAVDKAELFLCIRADDAGSEALVQWASAVEPDWLPASLTTVQTEYGFDETTERLFAVKRTRFLDLLIDERPTQFPSDAARSSALARAAAERLERVLPVVDSPAGRFLLRARWLAEAAPELDLPTLSDDSLRELLPMLCATGRSLAEVRSADWLGVLQGCFRFPQLQTLEREAPDRWEVPSGSRIPLIYELGRPPILAVRIQECFGMRETPRVALGKVKVLLHLLAPNSRPQQVTDDLASFWQNTYPRIRKELRARYPKHDWPEDPLTAVASRGPKRRD